MNSLHKLQQLLASGKKNVERGTVVATSADGVTVRTSAGLRKAKAAGASVYKVGDTVRIQGDVILGRSSSLDSLPVFRV